MRSITLSDYHRTFSDWLRRLQLCMHDSTTEITLKERHHLMKLWSIFFVCVLSAWHCEPGILRVAATDCNSTELGRFTETRLLTSRPLVLRDWASYSDVIFSPFSWRCMAVRLITWHGAPTRLTSRPRFVRERMRASITY